MGVPTALYFSYFIGVNAFCIVTGFNIDTKYAVIKEHGSADGYFGFSVAQHFTQENTPQNFDASLVRLLVGAPQARSSNALLNGFNETGALYSCPLNLKNRASVDDCTELPYPNTDKFTNILGSNIPADEDKSNMWLGVNIRSSGPGNFVLACGHRYKIIQKGKPIAGEDVVIDEKGEKQVNVFGIGICYNYKADLTVEDDEDDQAKAPCSGLALVDGDNSVSGEYGVCAAGTGLAAEEGDIIYGVAGARSFMGTIAWDRKVPFVDGPSFFDIKKPVADKQNPPSRLAAYRGYSAVIVRNLLNDQKEVAIVGAPADEDIGSVVVYELDQVNREIKDKLKFMGDQFGSAFGFSVAVVDIRNDKHPSMVVGAPFYRPEVGEDANTRMGISGAIYFYQNYNDGIRGDSSKVLITPGLCESTVASDCFNAQFGFSVTGVGDVNGDGLHDIAVGAPFYGRGAVFIYNGRSDGKLEETPSQVIMAESIDDSLISRSISGFGVSLSGGENMDGQGYADILVGAHSSSHIVLLRTRPVVTIEGSIHINNTLLNPKKGEVECLSDPSSSTSCIDFVICFTASFSQVGASTKSGAIATISYTLTGDSGYDYVGNRRVKFDKTAENSVKTGKVEVAVDGREHCWPQKVSVAEVKDVLQPVEFEMDYSLSPPSNIQGENINSFPIMNSLSYTKATDKIDFKRECTTPKCETDLAVSAMFTDTKNVISVDKANEFVFDSNKVTKLSLTITLTVNDEMDRAYEPFVFMDLESELRYTGVASSSDPSASCSDGNAQSTAIVCSFASILKGETKNITLNLAYDELGPSYTTINVTARTSSEDTHIANNFASLKVKVNIVTDLELLGSATRGDTVEYGTGDVKGVAAIEKDSDIGDFVQHSYTIINGEYGSVSKVKLQVQWPYEIAATGEYLLYMIMYPRIVGDAQSKGHCKPDCKNNDCINVQGYELVEEDTVYDSVSSVTLRRKREAEKKTGAATTAEVVSRNIANLNCYENTANCFNLTCEFFNLEPNETITVRFNSRLWNSSLTNDAFSDVDLVRITSTGHLYIDADAKVSQTNTTNDSRNVTTEAKPNLSVTVKPIQIWIIIVAAVAGIILLIVIILICWKCGFFKRNRPTTYGVKVEKQKGAYEQVSQKELEPLT